LFKNDSTSESFALTKTVSNKLILLGILFKRFIDGNLELLTLIKLRLLILSKLISADLNFLFGSFRYIELNIGISILVS
jgi:hypothetical protein